MIEIQMNKTIKTTYQVAVVLNFGHLDFNIVSDFGFGASNLFF